MAGEKIGRDPFGLCRSESEMLLHVVCDAQDSFHSDESLGPHATCVPSKELCLQSLT